MAELNPPFDRWLQRPEGPMSDLLRLLRTYEAAWRCSGDPAVAGLRPGVAAEVVEAELASIGLAATADLITWFAWHNGGEQWFGPSRWEMHSVHDAVLWTLQWRQIDQEIAEESGIDAEERWPNAFLAIGLRNQERLAIDTSVPVSAVKESPQDDWAPPEVVATSLAALVEYWTEMIACCRYVPDEYFIEDRDHPNWPAPPSDSPGARWM
jgi:hypothetical protein